MVAIPISYRNKISSIDVSFTDKEDPIHINIMHKKQIDREKSKGYQYAYLGDVKIG